MPIDRGRNGVRRKVAPDTRRRFLLPLALGAVVLLGVVVWLGNVAARRAVPVANATDADAARQRYDDLYQAAFRTDEGRAVLSVDAVFENAALSATLDAYAQRGLVQSQVQTLLANAQANLASLAFVITLTAPPGYAGSEGFTLSGYRPEASATLTDDHGRKYPVRGWSDIADPNATDSRTGMLTFDRSVDGKTPADAGVTTLRLELTGIPGGTRTFSWNLAVLGVTG